MISLYDGFDPYKTGFDASTQANENMKTYFELNKNVLRMMNKEKEIQNFLREGFKYTEEKLE